LATLGDSKLTSKTALTPFTPFRAAYSSDEPEVAVNATNSVAIKNGPQVTKKSFLIYVHFCSSCLKFLSLNYDKHDYARIKSWSDRPFNGRPK